MLLNRGNRSLGTPGGSFTSSGTIGIPGAFGAAPFFGTSADQLALQGLKNIHDANASFSTYTISFNSSPTAGTKWTPCLYSDNAGSPGTLIATGVERTATGSEGLSNQTYAFGSTQTLNANTQYWFGFLLSGTINIREMGGTGAYNLPGYSTLSRTYTLGCPTNPTGFSAKTNFMCVTLPVTLNRGVLGLWDLHPFVGNEYFSAVELDVISGTIPGSGSVSAQSIGLRLSDVVTVGGKYKGVIYADSAGAPGALVGVGSEVTIVSAATILTSTFSGVSLTGGNTYWFGTMADNTSRFVGNNNASTKWKANTYASGAPNPFGTPGGTSTRMAGVYLYFA